MKRREEVIGDCRLILGDCLEVMPTLEPVDAVVTDPPYGIGTGKAPVGKDGLKWGVQEWDKKIVSELVDTLAALDCPQIVWGGNYYPFPPSRCWLSWDKCQPDGWYSTAHFELAWTNMDRNARRWRMSQVEAYGNMDKAHPSQKPLPLMEWCIGHLPADAKTILDPFMGSGTTGVACVNLGRKFIGIELEPKYFDIACRRIEEAYKQPRLFEEPAPKAVQPSMFGGAA